MALLEKLEKGIRQPLWNFTAGTWWFRSPSCISPWDPGSVNQVCHCRWQGCFPDRWPWGQRLCYVTLHKVSSFKHPGLWQVKKISIYRLPKAAHETVTLKQSPNTPHHPRVMGKVSLHTVLLTCLLARTSGTVVHEMSKPQQHLRAIDEPEIERSHTRLST